MTDMLAGNMSLIGMPGSGKSTVGVLLAKRLGRLFVDTDLLLQASRGHSLQTLVDQEGFDRFCQLEEEIVLHLAVENHVIATGGSVVYGTAGMRHLKAISTVVFLQANLDTLAVRLTNFETRGVALRPGQTLEQLFRERNELYFRYADFIVASDGLRPEEVCQQIELQLKSTQP